MLALGLPATSSLACLETSNMIIGVITNQVVARVSCCLPSSQCACLEYNKEGSFPNLMFVCIFQVISPFIIPTASQNPILLNAFNQSLHELSINRILPISHRILSIMVPH